jgi:hypothetical protein
MSVTLDNGIKVGTDENSSKLRLASGLELSVAVPEVTPAPVAEVPKPQTSSFSDVLSQLSYAGTKLRSSALRIGSGLFEALEQGKNLLLHPIDTIESLADNFPDLGSGGVGMPGAVPDNTPKTEEQLYKEKEQELAANQRAQRMLDRRGLMGDIATSAQNIAQSFDEDVPQPETKAGVATGIVTSTVPIIADMLMAAVGTKVGVAPAARNLLKLTEGGTKIMETAVQASAFGSKIAASEIQRGLQEGKSYDEVMSNYFTSLGVNSATGLVAAPRFTAILDYFPKSKIAQLGARILHSGAASASMLVAQEIDQKIIRPEEGSALLKALSPEGLKETLPLFLATAVMGGRFRPEAEVRIRNFQKAKEEAVRGLSQKSPIGEMQYEGETYKVSVDKNGKSSHERISSPTLLGHLDYDGDRFEAILRNSTKLLAENKENPDIPTVIAENYVDAKVNRGEDGLPKSVELTTADGDIVPVDVENIYGAEVRGKLVTTPVEEGGSPELINRIMASDQKAKTKAAEGTTITTTLKSGEKLSVGFNEITAAGRREHLQREAQRRGLEVQPDQEIRANEFAPESSVQVVDSQGLPIGTDVEVTSRRESVRPQVEAMLAADNALTEGRQAIAGKKATAESVKAQIAAMMEANAKTPAARERMAKEKAAAAEEVVRNPEYTSPVETPPDRNTYGRDVWIESRDEKTTIGDVTYYKKYIVHEIDPHSGAETTTVSMDIKEANKLARTAADRAAYGPDGGRLYELGEYKPDASPEERAADYLTSTFGVRYVKDGEGNIFFGADLKGKLTDNQIQNLYRAELRNIKREDMLEKILERSGVSQEHIDQGLVELQKAIDSYAIGNPEYYSKRAEVEAGLRKANAVLFSSGYADARGKTPKEAETYLMRITNSLARAFEAANDLPEDSWYEVMFAEDPVNVIRRVKKFEGKSDPNIHQQVEGWHGTLEEFKQFSNEAIGTGAGNNEGWGHYITQVEKASEYFAEFLADGYDRENPRKKIKYRVKIKERSGKDSFTWLNWDELSGLPKDILAKISDKLQELNPYSNYRKDSLFKDFGKAIYRQLAEKLGKRGASEYLWSIGVDGTKYFGYSTTEQVREGADKSKSDYVVYDSSLLSIENKNTYYSLSNAMKGDKRVLGETIWKDGKAVINFYKGSDIQTGLHEIGHVWRRSISGKDLRVITAWAFDNKKDDPKQWDTFKTQADQDAARAAEEKFVDHYVSWIARSKKAVTGDKELDAAFKNVSRVLISLRSTTRLLPDSEVSPEMREFMGRVIQRQMEPMSEWQLGDVRGKLQGVPKYVPKTNINTAQRNMDMLDSKAMEIVAVANDTDVDAGNVRTIKELKAVVRDKLDNDPAYKDELLQRVAEGRTNQEDNMGVIELFARESKAFLQEMRWAQPWERDAVVKKHLANKETYSAYQKQAFEAGQALKMFDVRQMSDDVAQAKFALTLRQLLETPGGEARAKELLDAAKNGDLSVLDKYEHDPTMWDVANQIMYTGLLWNPAIWNVNLVSTAIWTTWQIPHRILATGVDATVVKMEELIWGKEGARARKYYASEILPYLAGTGRGFVEGMEIAGRKLPLIRSLLGPMNVETMSAAMTFASDKILMDAHAHESKALERISIPGSNKYDPMMWAQNGLYYFNQLLNVSTDILSASDAIFRTMAYASEQNAVAARAWEKAGRPGSEKEFVKKYVPTDLEQLAIRDYARYNIFTDLPGSFTRSVSGFREKHPSSKMLLPFLTTIVNVGKRGVEITPGIGAAFEARQNRGRKMDLATSEGRAAGIGKGEGKEGKQRALTEYAKRNYSRFESQTGHTYADIVAKQIEGAIISAMAVFGLEDDRIQGAMPRTAQGRAEMQAKGALPWSVRLGDSWYSFDRMDPFSKPLKMIAMIKSTMREWNAAGKDPEKFNLAEKLMDAGIAMGVELTGSSIFGNFQALVGSRGEGASRAAARVVARTATNFVPMNGFFRWVGKEMNMLSNDGQYIPPEVDGVLNQAIAPTFFWLYDNLPPQKTVFGEPVVRDVNSMFTFLIPIASAPAKMNAVNEYCAKVGHFPTLPDDVIELGGREIKLDKDVHAEYALWYGQNAYKTLDKIVKSGGLRKLPRDKQLDYIENVLTPLRRAGAGKALAAQSKKPGGIQAAMVPEETSPFVK